jgi:hypothetical protein
MVLMGLPNDDAVLAAVGKIAIRHGQLDHSLKMLIKGLAGVKPEEAERATERLSARELRQRARKLAVRRFGEGATLVRLDALLEQCRVATDKRNDVLHSLWGLELDGPAVMRRGETMAEIPTAAELEVVAQEIHHIAHILHQERLEGFLKEALLATKPPLDSRSDADVPRVVGRG